MNQGTKDFVDDVSRLTFWEGFRRPVPQDVKALVCVQAAYLIGGGEGDIGTANMKQWLGENNCGIPLKLQEKVWNALLYLSIGYELNPALNNHKRYSTKLLAPVIVVALAAKNKGILCDEFVFNLHTFLSRPSDNYKMAYTAATARRKNVNIRLTELAKATNVLAEEG